MSELKWNELDERAVDTARVLAAEAVDKAGSGHPGTAISLAPVAYLLYQKIMKLDPKDPKWVGRDRFVLSIGHSSLTQYLQLMLAGFGLEPEDIAKLRTEGSLTPGHPEYGHTAGVEVTTGPLGAGLANAVGFAMASRRERGLLDPLTPDGESVFNYNTYVIAGDGDMQEGVTSEASSLAATQKLGSLIVIYDDNHISIEGDTKIAFTEDVAARYAAYGWHVQELDWTNGGTEYIEDVQGLYDAIMAAQAVTDKPSLIRLRTIIGWPLPHKAGSHSIHGSKIGAEETAALKEKLGFDTEKFFVVEPEVMEHTRTNAAERATKAKEEWQERFDAWRFDSPDKGALFDRLAEGRLPEGFEDALPVYEPGKKSTRSASGEVLTALADAVPELWGGSADLAGSNNTTMKGQPSFLPPEQSSADFKGDYNGRTLHFGIREHAMGNILNAINAGLTRAYGGTFFVFADYMRGAVRLAALQGLPSIFVWSHDSIGVGEDGPTHQPVEHLWSYRAIPGLDIVRPADANEVAAAWAQILRDPHPTGLILSRQDLPIVERGEGLAAPAANVAKGGYVLYEAKAEEKVALLATGSEVGLAVAAREELEKLGIGTRVVSLPCLEWFDAQSEEYRKSVIPDGLAKVSIEAGIGLGWRSYVGDKGEIISLEHFGESAPGSRLFEKYGFTVENVVEKAQLALSK
ncbi:MAG: transketolase [Propionibacteriaceae bacterium]|jgi:transketolase|nr:transketolase [Propionibacteriaceae bacterium]